MESTLKKQMILDLDILEKKGMLHLVSQFIDVIKNQNSGSTTNVLEKFAGSMAKEDVEEIEAIINAEFNNIEGEW